MCELHYRLSESVPVRKIHKMGALRTELKLRQDSIRYDVDKLIRSGTDEKTLLRIVEQAYKAGIVADKIENIRIHDILSEIEESL